MTGYINGENVALLLFAISMYALCTKRNILRSIIALSIMQAAAILFFIALNNSSSKKPPIGQLLETDPTIYADPMPQALMITAVVIGISVTALSLTMLISLHHKYGSINWARIKGKRGDEND